MAEEAVAWVLDALIEEGAGWFASAVVEAAGYVVVAASVYNMREQQRQAQNRAKDAYNASLRDRYVMQRSATQQRSMVLGRARVSGPMALTRSFGTDSANLVMIVALAAHECDAIEAIYFDDDRLVTDVSGNVLGTVKTELASINAASMTFTLAVAAASGTVSAVATYDTGDVNCGVSLSGDGFTVTISGASATKVGALAVTYQPLVNVFSQSLTNVASASTVVIANGSGAGNFAAPVTLIVESARATRTGLSRDFTLSTSVAGNNISFSGAGAGDSVTITYQYTASSSSRARVRKYLGAPGQVADARLISLLPDYWTSSHRGDDICHVIVELDYDPDSFPGGLPNVSAVVRGLKCYDPRTSTTAWTDNAALLMRGYWLHALGANRSASEIDDTALIAAANTCDTSVTYTVGDKQFTRPLYRANTVANKDRRAQDVLNDLAQAMGGRWVILNNTLRVRAGAYAAPVAAMDETWLHDGSPVQIQPRRNRSDLVNATAGTFADEAHDWQTLSYPKVAPAAYATADGRELATDVHYPGVTFSGQCQFLSRSTLRYARAGLTLRMSCNMRAYPLEVFDCVTLSLARFGWVAKTFEVLEAGFSLEGLVDLTLKEIDPSIWALDATFDATDYARKTTLPSPWLADVPVLAAPDSGTAYLLKQGDGTIVSRIHVAWSGVNTANVLNGGKIELQWRRIGDSNDIWESMTVPGDMTSAYLSNVQDGRAYVIRARSSTRLASSNWSLQEMHIVVGKTAAPAAVSGLAAVVVPGALRITRTPSTELDYTYTLYRYGASWAAGTAVPGTSDERGCLWAWPAPGSYTIWAADVDTTGHVGTPVSYGPVTVTAAALAPTSSALSIKLNVADFAGTLNYNECWIHGRDGAGAAVDAPGAVLLNGVAVAVPNGLLYGSQGPFAGYIVLDTGRTTFTVGGNAGYPYAAARRYQGAWQYDDNGSWVTFTSTAAHAIIGTVQTTAPDAGFPGTPPGVIAATMWASGTTLDSQEASADAAYAIAAAAQGTANTAAANATSALSTLATMRSNGYLDAAEKPAVLREWTALSNEFAGLQSQADAYGITTEKTAYVTAINALSDYLTALSPGWADTTTDTPITPAVDQAKWADAYYNRQLLLNKVANEAAKRANWGQISSRPADAELLNSYVQVGGRNLLTRAAIGGTATTDYFGGNNAAYMDLGAGAVWRMNPWTSHEVGTYSVSGWIKASVATSVAFDLCDFPSHAVAVTTAWQFFSLEGEYNSSSYLNSVYFGFLDFLPASACRLYISNLKLETGTKATGWSPAPEDVDARITAAQSAAAAAIGDAADAQATADGKVTTFVQTSAPTAEGVGDLWIDSDDANKLYRWSGSAWVAIRDTGIGQALSDASNAQATADGKIVSFYQTSPPTASAVGDLWTDTDDSNKLYRWSGSAWVSLRDAGIALAISNAATAQATADGKIDSFYQTSPPSVFSNGDIWFDTDDGNKQYVAVGGSWVVAADARIGTAITAAAGAQATADGKVTTFYASSAPTATAVGDLWSNTTAGSTRLSRWSGSAWVLLSVVGTGDIGTGELAADAATEITQDSYAFSGAGTGSGPITQRSFTVTPPVNAKVNFTATIGASQVLPDAGNYLSWFVSAGGGADVLLGSCNSTSGNRQTFPCSTSFSATGGVALTFKLVSDRTSGNPAIALYDSAMRVEVVKR